MELVRVATLVTALATVPATVLATDLVGVERVVVSRSLEEGLAVC